MTERPMMRRRRSTLKRIEFLVLAVLAETPLHGYGIVLEIRRRTGGRASPPPGSLYRVLDRLMDRGLLEKTEREKVQAEAEDPRRSYYRITARGLRAVMAEAELLGNIAARVARVLVEGEPV